MSSIKPVTIGRFALRTNTDASKISNLQAVPEAMGLASGQVNRLLHDILVGLREHGDPDEIVLYRSAKDPVGETVRFRVEVDPFSLKIARAEQVVRVLDGGEPQRVEHWHDDAGCHANDTATTPAAAEKRMDDRRRSVFRFIEPILHHLEAEADVAVRSDLSAWDGFAGDLDVAVGKQHLDYWIAMSGRPAQIAFNYGRLRGLREAMKTIGVEPKTLIPND